jgi:hypothetical protein
VVSVQNLILRNTGARLSAHRLKQLSSADLERLLPESDQALAVSSGLAVIRCLAVMCQHFAGHTIPLVFKACS